MSVANIIFYSNKCEASQHLLTLMERENLTRFFYSVCTDNNPKIPPEIKYTPTLMIKGINNPYVANDAFAWLAKIKQCKIAMMMQRMNTQQQQYFQNVNNNLNKDEDNDKIFGFSEAEMGSMSDIFSFFNKNITQECQDACPQKYYDIDCLGQQDIFLTPLESGTFKLSDNSKFKINDSKQMLLTKKLKAEREQQDKQFEKNIKNFKDQLNMQQ